jgi:outer membrane lipoprotein SlyB
VDRYAHYGRVTRIDTVQADRRNVGVGTVLGAVIGGALGNQVGSGTGRAAATVGGAVAGGVIGNQVENRNRNDTAGYEVYVRLDNGDSRVINVADTGGLEVGERVRVEGSNIVRL